MKQLLEDRLNKSAFAVAMWRGDAKRCWFKQVVETARARHDQWLQSTPDQRAGLEPACILSDCKLIPESANAMESALRAELLDALPKPIADAFLPPNVNEIATQTEILSPPKIPPSTLDQTSTWLEDTQHRLDLRIKTRHNVHPRTLFAFVTET